MNTTDRLQLRRAAKAWVGAITVAIGAAAPQVANEIGNATAALIIAVLAVVLGGAAVYETPNRED